MHEHIQESLLLGRRTNRNLAWRFHSFLKVLKGAFCRKAPIPKRNDQLKPGELLSLI